MLNTFYRIPGYYQHSNAQQSYCLDISNERRCGSLSCDECMFNYDDLKNRKAFFEWNKGIPIQSPPTDQAELEEESVGDMVESMTSTGLKIIKVCNDLKEILLAKNKAYGDSATDPLRIFGKSTALEGLCTRIDDKLNRIYKGSEYLGDDTVDDLIGYLVLYKIVKAEGGGNAQVCL